MLGFLFRGLTTAPSGAVKTFDVITAAARQPHWYLQGNIPDTIDGRFAVMATICALVMARLEQLGEGGNALSVELTERFIAVMESEHRELGLGDPALGKTVRKLVGALARRTDSARDAVSGEQDWRKAAEACLYRGDGMDEPLTHSTAALQQLWARIAQASLNQLRTGEIR